MCVPRHDSPSVFSAMLDRAAGGFKVAPYGVREPSVLCEPVFGYGQRRARWEFSGPGYGEAVAGCGGEGNPVLHLLPTADWASRTPSRSFAAG